MTIQVIPVLRFTVQRLGIHAEPVPGNPGIERFENINYLQKHQRFVEKRLVLRQPTWPRCAAKQITVNR